MQIAKIHLAPWLHYASLRGISLPVDELGSNAVTANDDPAATVSIDEYYKLLEILDGALKDELLGIRVGESYTLKLLGIIYQVSLQTHSISEALNYLSSYMQASFPQVQLSARQVKKQFHLEISLPHGAARANRFILEHLVTIISREVSLMAAEEVNFIKTSPYYTARYPEGWRKENTFSLSFDDVLLKAAMASRKEQHLELLIPEYLKLLSSFQSSESFSHRVKQSILSLADPFLPSIEPVANLLFVTPRTLQRNLANEGCSFRQIRDELKKEIALLLLQHPTYAVKNIALLLGYAEPASFIHAFKNWTGSPPAQARQVQINSLPEETGHALPR